MGTITCEPKQLADALSAVKSAVNTRSPIQALAGVRITANGNTVTLAATDMDLFIRRELPATVDGDVDICVSHAELVKVAKAFAKNENLNLTVVPRGEGAIGPVNLACASGSRKIEIPGLRLEDFPDEPNAGGHEVLVGANGANLAAIIERAAKFASRDDTRPVLTGIYVEAEDDRLVLVATDSYRLCALTLKSELTDAACGFNVSARGLTAAAKLMRKEPAVTLRAYSPDTSVGQAIIEWPGTRVYSRLILGQYPNWRQLMPDTFPNEVVVPVGELRSACDVAVQFLVKNCPVRFYVNGVVKLHGHVPDGASVEEILPGAKASMDREAELPNGEFEIGLNPEFLRDIAHVLEGDHAVVKLISPMRPALIESQQGAEKYLIMPIRLNV